MELFFVVLDPVEVVATLGGVVAGGVAMVSFNEAEDFIAAGLPGFVLGHFEPVYEISMVPLLVPIYTDLVPV